MITSIGWLVIVGTYVNFAQSPEKMSDERQGHAWKGCTDVQNEAEEGGYRPLKMFAQNTVEDPARYTE